MQSARLLGSVHGVVVHATRAALFGSPIIGNDTIIAGSDTSYTIKATNLNKKESK